MSVKMKENEKDFLCSYGHKKEAILIWPNPKLQKNQRLLCQECVENQDINERLIGIKLIVAQIQEEQEKKIQVLENMVRNKKQSIEKLINIVDEMRTKAFNLFEIINNILKDWIKDLEQQIKQDFEYSFHDELEAKILNQFQSDDNAQLITKEMMKINNFQPKNLTSRLRELSEFLDNKCKEILQSPILSTQNLNQCEQQQFLQIGNQQGILEEGEIRFKLIDQSIKQVDTCRAIVFDITGSIMVSTSDNDIKVWKFLNGQLQLASTLVGHTDWISCLVYSKQQNSFISVALDYTIICWQQQNQVQWIHSQPYYKHTGFIRCAILNLNEDLLFSGSEDKSIIIWKVDLKLNELTYDYTLDKHQNGVTTLSLNQSETVLVSCAYDTNQIIIWERSKEYSKYEFKYLVIIVEIYIIKGNQNNQAITIFINIINCFEYKQSILDFGFQVKFINENQFIWITGGQKFDQLFIFELDQGLFQENQKKTLQLLLNNQICDENCFPVIYNKKRNLIVIRHKTFIYIIRETINGMLKIVNHLNCNTNDIYGSITNNGQYLVYWDAENEGYSFYELLYN